MTLSEPCDAGLSATLIYDNENQLIGIRNFDGRIDIDDVELLLSDGPIIAGILDTPVTPSINVDGSGAWPN
ncbi:hypothetical protein CVT25_010842 [Psilocybe cyanescens]|uniref:Uncharacterized protein n=1 Tax=Psilocybe cyanescens TaxID=93625 RepID=A0A409WF19_PSICY|nr:hypothetical protein CVT25_010842 [Psilocybe cyanescens]